MSRSMGYVVAAAILAGSAGAASLLIASRPEPARREPPRRVPVAITEPAVAGAGAIPIHGAGTVRPRAQIDVAAEIGGRVVWVNPAFQSGGRVRRGQPLFRLDDADHRHRVERARAAIAVQQVELLRVEEEARIAREQYERFLRRRGDGPPPAGAGPLALWEPQIEAARAAADRERAVLAEAELGLSRTEVQAPFAGVVRSESVDTGQFLTAGQAVGQLYAMDAVEVVVPLSDSDAALIPGLWDLRPGDANRRVAARVVADYGDARHAWAGYVDRVEPALDEGTRTLDVIVRVPDPFSPGARVEPRRAGEGAAGAGPDAGSGAGADASPGPPLIVGKFVDVRIDGFAPLEYFRVPRPALRPDNEVWAVRDDMLTIVSVRVLQRYDDEVWVTGALAPGLPVVVGGMDIAAEGMAVRTVPGGDR